MATETVVLSGGPHDGEQIDVTVENTGHKIAIPIVDGAGGFSGSRERAAIDSDDQAEAEYQKRPGGGYEFVRFILNPRRKPGELSPRERRAERARQARGR